MIKWTRPSLPFSHTVSDQNWTMGSPRNEARWCCHFRWALYIQFYFLHNAPCRITPVCLCITCDLCMCVHTARSLSFLVWSLCTFFRRVIRVLRPEQRGRRDQGLKLWISCTFSCGLVANSVQLVTPQRREPGDEATAALLYPRCPLEWKEWWQFGSKMASKASSGIYKIFLGKGERDSLFTHAPFPLLFQTQNLGHGRNACQWGLTLASFPGSWLDSLGTRLAWHTLFCTTFRLAIFREMWFIDCSCV